MNDLAQLPDDEFRACMAALRTAVLEARRVHAIAQREGISSADRLSSFRLSIGIPGGGDRLDLPRLAPDTPIEGVPLGGGVQKTLKSLRIFCIEDLTAISESELLAEQFIGRKTTNRLRELLARLGMEFSPDPDPMQRALDQSKAIQALPPEARAAALRDLKDLAPAVEAIDSCWERTKSGADSICSTRPLRAAAASDTNA